MRQSCREDQLYDYPFHAQVSLKTNATRVFSAFVQFWNYPRRDV